MTKRNTKKALVVSLLSLLLCCSMLVGTTFAWFTDAVTSGNNKIVAGNLDVELEYLVGSTWTKVTENTNVFEENTLWEPGHTEVVYLKVSNLGTLALDYKLGVNIAHETGSTNVGGTEFELSDYIQMAAIKGVTTAYASREAARAAVTSSKAIKEGYAQEGKLYPANNLPTDGVKEEYVALVVYMPESVGNEANYKTGYAAPEILLGINLLATQETYEKDSFNNLYDENAALPIVGTGSAPVGTNPLYVEVEARIQNDGSAPKMASFRIPAGALAEGVENVSVIVEKTNVDENITVATNQEAMSFDVTVTGLKEDNNEPIQVQFELGEPASNITIYHYGQPIKQIADAPDGTITFETTSFSPYTVTFDADYVASTPTESGVPEAEIEEIEVPGADTSWTYGDSFLGTPEVKEGQLLDVAYQFDAPHDETNINDTPYKDWICDFYVMIELADTTIATLPEGKLFLGGYYDGFGWVGFNNPEVETGKFIPLLQSVGMPWTYADIATQVGTFKCGVARAVGYETSILNNAKFTVQLRLVDPTGAAKDIIVSEIVHTFPTVVTSGEELQDAVNNGSTNIQLGNDIDLSNGGIVIP